jgi:NADH:ubiquinone oxidoreductase subunit F (NADH-binding)/(2Fe-2S) ferredoxin
VAIRVCGGSGCIALGALEVIEALQAGAAGSGSTVTIESKPCVVGCRGFCSQGPLVHLPGLDVLYCRVRQEDVDEILDRTVGRSEVIDRLLYHEPASGQRYRGLADNPFFANQDRQVLARCGVVDPEDVEHAVALGAYDALRRSLLDLDPVKIIDLVKRSGLQERSGAGFPVGLKWALVADTPGQIRYVVGNGEGGDPGPTADRTLVEGDPHSVVEGMAIAGYAVGAREGRLFLRSEHRLAVARAERAVEQARHRGFLGSKILGSGFDFSIEICENAGASMGGEETSLLNALQGRRAVARPRPPFPAVSGLWGCPTLINGLETLANIPLIVLPERLGADVRPAGTKVVSVSGAVPRPGVAEVPIGTSLARIVEEIAGAGADDGVLGAHLGGPGGVTLSRSQFDTTVDFGSLRNHEANLGSGSVVVLGPGSCPVALARFFVGFCAEESCGTCPPCRIGTRVVLNLLDRIGSGAAEASDLKRLERLCRHIRQTSLCELGRNATGSVITGLGNFRREYEAHLSGRGCPTGSCG